MRKQIRIGSRESELAVIQAEIVKQGILRQYPDWEVEMITMKTTGDLIQNQSLDQIGGKGLFVKELDLALLAGEIDLSVHSLKDMPMTLPEELPLIAYTHREDPRDVLIYAAGNHRIPDGGVIGTSSRRRMLQLKKLYPDCTFTGIRGNVQTRLKKLTQESYDGTILAAAGLKRLNMEQIIGRAFTVSEVIPAAGQGILAVQGRRGENEELISCLNHPDSEAAALAERQFVSALDGGCSSPVAAYAEISGRNLRLTGLYVRETDESYYVDQVTGGIKEAQRLGEQLAFDMRRTYGE